MNPITRRRLLATSVAGAGAALAGCTGSDSGDDDEPQGGNETDDEEDEDQEPAVPMLHDVRLDNRHEDVHTVHVLVERADEIVHWSSTDLEYLDKTPVERTWNEEPGAFVVSARLDDQSSWEQIDLTRERSICYGIDVEVTGEGDLEIGFRQEPEECTHPDA